jgi:L-asparaginase / beta-aspartyl-peptidase
LRALFVHGGVSGTKKDSRPPMDYAFPAALVAATALDAVELSIRALEDDPALNAGYGAVLNRDGGIELDAGIAYSATGGCGGIANVQVKHAITLARRVMEETPHVLITGAGAQALGADLEQLSDTTEEQRRRWEEAKAEDSFEDAHFGAPEHVDTVGAVALDDAGNLAAGSSTGGVFGKLPGRVGDSPIVGAGFYTSEHAAVVGTGVGEIFLETLACLRTAELIANGIEPQKACREVILAIQRPNCTLGLLALDARGRVGVVYRGGSWPVEGRDGPIEAESV